MPNKILPPPHHVVVERGPWLHSVWLGLWMSLLTLAMGLVIKPLQFTVMSWFGAVLLTGQHLGYGLFGHLAHREQTPEQWMQQGLMRKIQQQLRDRADKS